MHATSSLSAAKRWAITQTVKAIAGTLSNGLDQGSMPTVLKVRKSVSHALAPMSAGSWDILMRNKLTVF